MADVKNVMEALDLIEQTAVVVVDALGDDGKVSVLDLPKLFKLWAPVKDAIEGIDQALAEVKELDSAEVQALLVKVVAVGQAWSAVFMKSKLV